MATFANMENCIILVHCITRWTSCRPSYSRHFVKFRQNASEMFVKLIKTINRNVEYKVTYSRYLSTTYCRFLFTIYWSNARRRIFVSIHFEAQYNFLSYKIKTIWGWSKLGGWGWVKLKIKPTQSTWSWAWDEPVNIFVTAQPQPQPNSTSTQVGVDKVISWTTHPPTPHHTTPKLLRYFQTT